MILFDFINNKLQMYNYTMGNPKDLNLKLLKPLLLNDILMIFLDIFSLNNTDKISSFPLKIESDT